MTYEQQIRMIVTFLYNETKCFATSSTYHIPYKKIESAYGLWVGTETVKDDIREEFGKNHLDRIQALDFDDIKEEVIVMIWESNKKKKYTIDDYKEFCNNALGLPPLDEFDDGNIDEEEWYKIHKIHIIVDNHDMELNYYADNVTEICDALREMYGIEKEVNPDIKIFSKFDVYNHLYNYDVMKVVSVLSTTNEAKKLRYEDYMCIAEAVYAHWVDGRDESEDAKYKKYPWLEIQGREEDGYIQAYAKRTLPNFIKLYKETMNND